MKHIVSLSGGKDSTAMLLRMVDEGMHIDEIICCDTTVEYPEMYRHLERLQQYIGMTITIIRPAHNFEWFMFEKEKTKGKHKGEKGLSWPDFRVRWCTGHLKRDLIKSYMKKYKGQEITEYHGIAADEAARTESNKDGRVIRYPLVEWRMTEADCLRYCYGKGFDWDGLYERFGRTGCYLCPLQGLKKLRILYTYYPELWAYMRELDKRSIEQFGRKFRSDYSIEELEQKFEREKQQRKLF